MIYFSAQAHGRNACQRDVYVGECGRSDPCGLSISVDSSEAHPTRTQAVALSRAIQRMLAASRKRAPAVTTKETP